jgi:hypothetical protein
MEIVDRVSRAVLCLLALAAALLGCGTSSDGGGEPRPGVAASLDADNLAVVHDELYACLREQLPGALLANYLGGQASISDSYNRASFDERLAAPKAESALLDAGRAEFIGVRANRRGGRGRGLPEWDVLILPTAGDAERAAAAIAEERGRADQDGIFVRVVKRAGRGRRARTAEAALTRCLNLSRRG